ncbi:hypothetical protein VTL71DRAFT_1804 [Oculimacula yallundae]|uniref:Uncharacterized protein n=1 Tax=Oculimacula yallundae TaxID=86028 RepID=A0ABR4CBV3_9HELO
MPVSRSRRQISLIMTLGNTQTSAEYGGVLNEEETWERSNGETKRSAGKTDVLCSSFIYRIISYQVLLLAPEARRRAKQVAISHPCPAIMAIFENHARCPPNAAQINTPINSTKLVYHPPNAAPITPQRETLLDPSDLSCIGSSSMRSVSCG